MGTILVVAEHLEGELKKVTLPTIGFAQKAAAINGDEVVGVVIGSGIAGVAGEMAKHGVSRVIAVDAPEYANYLAESWTPALSKLASDLDASIVCAAASTTGKDFLPRLAADLDAGMVSDVIDVYDDEDEGLSYKRPIWAGNLIAKVTSDSDVTVVSVRTTNFEAPAEGGAAAVENTSPGTGASPNTEFVAFQQVKSDRPALTDADAVVSGGRGLKAAESFGMLEELADKLGAAVGASRAAVDSGYAPNDWQVGQTGKIVAPNLYIAIAISGAIQHLAGMKGSKTIVAINKDPEAPIFQVADYGLVADAFQAVPELNSKL